jgi:pterin-4a-carbinolamine dehydratase
MIQRYKIKTILPNIIFIIMNLQEQTNRIKQMMGLITESDPKTGTGKKPKGSDRRLYTDENPSDTVSVKFKTKEDIVDTLNKESFKSKSHARQSQIINLIHQRLRVALERAKDPEVKKRLKTAFEYIVDKKEESKKKTQEMKENELDSKIETETKEYARTLGNARKQGVGLRFPKSAVKSNPQRFRYYTRQNTNEMKNDSDEGKQEWSETNGKLTREYKFSSYEDTIDFVNKVSEIAEKQKHHPKMIVGYNSVKVIMFDHEKGEISDKCYKFTSAVDDMMGEEKNKGEQNETELTEKCWAGYTQKGMKTMFGKQYPNCVKKTKKK